MAETSVKRHPIAAVLWGIVGGLGVTLFLMGRAQIAIGKWTAPIIIIVVVVVLNVLWAYFGPAKKPKGAPPAKLEHETVPTMADAGFDAVGEGVEPGSARDSALAPPPSVADPGLAPPPSPSAPADEGGSEDPI